jgi:hypothetical protein
MDCGVHLSPRTDDLSVRLRRVGVNARSVGNVYVARNMATAPALKGQLIPAQGNALGKDGRVGGSPEGAVQWDADRVGLWVALSGLR